MTRSVGVGQVLANGRFRTLWIGSVVSAIGDTFYILAVPILVEQLTGSTRAIGLALIFTVALPQLVFGMPAGALVDRWDRRQVMIVSNLLRAVLVLGAVLVKQPQDVWILYAVGFMTSTVSRFYGPAWLAVIPALVSDFELVVANSLSQLTMTIATLVGPALAGFAIGWWGPSVAFALDAVSFVVAAVAVWRVGTIAAPAPPSEGPDAEGYSLWREVRNGLDMFARSRPLRGILLTTAVVYLGLGAITALWVPLLGRYHGVKPEGLGLVYSIMGLGMAIGGLAAGALAARFRKTRVCVVGLLMVGIPLALLGWAPSGLVIAILGFVGALAVIPIQATVSTLAQQLTPDEARGRVFSAIYTFGQVAFLLSIAAAATMADLIGIRNVYAYCGALVVFGGIVFAILVREPTDGLDVAAPSSGTALLQGLTPSLDPRGTLPGPRDTVGDR